MKNLKKVLCLSLVIAMILSFTGCGLLSSKKVTKEELIENAISFVEDVESIDASVAVLLDMELEENGEEASVSINLQNDAQVHLESDTAYVNLNLEANVLDDNYELELELYRVNEDNEPIGYYQEIEDGEDYGWKREEMSDGKYLPETVKILKKAQKSIEKLTLEDGMKFDGKDCYVLSGTIDNIEPLFDMYDLVEMVGDIDYEDIEVNISLYFDEDTKVLLGISANAANGLEEVYGEYENVENTEVEQFDIIITFNSFNDLEEIEVPKSVKKKVEEAGDVTQPTESTKPADDKEDKDDEEDGGDLIIPTTPSETKPAETKPAETTELSSNWKDLDIKIDGVVYTFPYDYDKLNENGWYIKLSEYGYEDGYILNKNDKVSGTIDMYHKSYGEEYRDFSMWVGFKNYGDKAADILECDLWAIQLDRYYGSSLKDKYPTVEIAKGITWGSTKADIIAAFGEPDDTYRTDDLGYTVLDYEDGYSIYMSLTVYDKEGLTKIDMKNYD